MLRCEKSNQGMILITTLLFLWVILLLGLVLAESSLLQRAIQKNYHNTHLAFQQAENYLITAERAVVMGETPLSGAPWHYEPWITGFCTDKTCYKITATAQYKKSQIILYSILWQDSALQWRRLAWWSE